MAFCTAPQINTFLPAYCIRAMLETADGMICGAFKGIGVGIAVGIIAKIFGSQSSFFSYIGSWALLGCAAQSSTNAFDNVFHINNHPSRIRDTQEFLIRVGISGMIGFGAKELACRVGSNVLLLSAPSSVISAIALRTYFPTLSAQVQSDLTVLSSIITGIALIIFTNLSNPVSGEGILAMVAIVMQIRHIKQILQERAAGELPTPSRSLQHW